MSKKIKFRYYKVSVNIDANLLTSGLTKATVRTELLQKLQSASKPTDVFSISGHHAFTKSIEQDNNILCLEKHRQTHLPTIGTTTEDRERPIDLEEDESIMEKNFFLLGNNALYVLYQEKKEGYWASSLGNYFTSLYSTEGVKISLEAILSRESYEKFMRLGYIKSLDLSFASPSDALLSEWGISIEDRFGITTDGETSFQIGMKFPTKKTWTQTARNSFLQKFIVHDEEIRRAVVKGSELEGDPLTELNLSSDVLEEMRSVRSDTTAMFEENVIEHLKDIDRTMADEIREIIDGNN